MGFPFLVINNLYCIRWRRCRIASMPSNRLGVAIDMKMCLKATSPAKCLQNSIRKPELPDPSPNRPSHTIARYTNLSSILAWRDVSSKVDRVRFQFIKHKYLGPPSLSHRRHIGESRPDDQSGVYHVHKDSGCNFCSDQGLLFRIRAFVGSSRCNGHSI